MTICIVKLSILKSRGSTKQEYDSVLVTDGAGNQFTIVGPKACREIHEYLAGDEVGFAWAERIQHKGQKRVRFKIILATAPPWQHW